MLPATATAGQARSRAGAADLLHELLSDNSVLSDHTVLPDHVLLACDVPRGYPDDYVIRQSLQGRPEGCDLR
ncbi:MAG: hypothetical protein ACTHMY_11045 [Solirubrobacteraceae bacterium]